MMFHMKLVLLTLEKNENAQQKFYQANQMVIHNNENFEQNLKE